MAKKGFRRIPASGFPIESVTPEGQRRLAKQTMEEVAEDTMNHFLEGFRKGGGQTDSSRSGWDERKNNVDPGRAILVGPGTGHLRNDINVRRVTHRSAQIGTLRIPYAMIHNRGGLIRRGKKVWRMPKREFIGKSGDLTVSNRKEISRRMKKNFITT